MNDLKIMRTLEYYDVPHLFIAEDDNGVSFLCMLYDIANDGELKFISVTVSADKLNDFIKGQVDLLTMFTSPELKNSIFHIYMKKEGVYAEHYNGVLDSSMLPNEGYFYNDDYR